MIELTNDFMKQWGRTRPCLALTGLNPHAGEGGLFGDEERRILLPALERARKTGIEVQGPLPADTVFHQALEGAFDAVVALYHDQALIPIKTLDFHGGVNVTMGLPFVRTSPDHGTAFAIAGQGIARPTSMRAALATAADLAARRKRSA
jgi:4-hydroxythreonine-4-phosphate dehydrogenase